MATIFVSALAFILLLTLLILIHEAGHYALAKFFAVEVEEFGFGLPPRATTLFRKWGTDFTLNWVPFGGFVRLKGENAVEGRERFEKGSFAKAGFIARASILLGGVAMNFLLAVALLTIGFSIGRWVPSWYMTLEQLEAAVERGDVQASFGVLVSDVEPEGPAARAGLPGDVLIHAVDGVSVRMPSEIIALQEGKAEVTYTFASADDPLAVHDVVVSLEDGIAGIQIQPVAFDVAGPRRGLLSAFGMSLRESAFMAEQTVFGIGNLFRSIATRGQVPEGISGIVGIAVLTYGSVQEGWMTYLRLVALLSLSLAILNILPLPALDGGRLLFVLVEWVTRRPLNRKFELMTNAFGFLFLMGLIILITVNDIWHLFTFL